MLALSESLNFVELLLLSFSRAQHLFSFLIFCECATKTPWGYFFDFSATSFSNFLYILSLFLPCSLFQCTYPSTRPFALIQRRCCICFWCITSWSCLSTGKLPFSLLEGFPEVVILATNCFLKSQSLNFNEHHRSSTVLSPPDSMYSSSHPVSAK